MAKRIAFSILCTLLVLVVILTGIVIRRVSRIMLWSPSADTPPASGPETLSKDPTSPIGEATEPTQAEHTHQFVLTSTVSATCEGHGWNIYTCSTCGHVDMPADEQQAPLGHNDNEGEVILPTCTEGGHTIYTCLRCMRIIMEDETEPLGHAFDLQTVIAPTCTEDGYTIISCSHEGCTEIQETVFLEGSATGHVFGSWSYRDNGMGVQFCENCNSARLQGDEEIIPPDTYAILDQTRTELVDTSGEPFVLYMISVGKVLESTANSFIYTIEDYLNNGSLEFYYDPQLGLVISYTDQDDMPQQVILEPESSQSVTIPAVQEQPQE